MITGKLEDINLTRESWNDKIFITCDVDWASEEVMNYCIKLFLDKNINVTWFCTHKGPYLDILKKNPDLFEIAWHPNFNNILFSTEKKSVKDVFKEMRKSIGDSKGFRSHSVTQSSGIISCAKDVGLRYESNTFIPITSEIEVKPYIHTSKIMQLPYIWEDDVHYLNNWNYQSKILKLLEYRGMKIIDFHPIHIFLNTAKQEHYDSARPFFQDYDELQKKVNIDSFGTRNFLLELINILN
jgi:hypothetical protein